MKITEEQLKEWEEISKKGEWVRIGNREGFVLDNEAFNEMARTAVPLLIEEVRDLRRHLDDLLRDMSVTGIKKILDSK